LLKGAIRREYIASSTEGDEFWNLMISSKKQRETRHSRTVEKATQKHLNPKPEEFKIQKF
jgi:hypothetical protein